MRICKILFQPLEKVPMFSNGDDGNLPQLCEQSNNVRFPLDDNVQKLHLRFMLKPCLDIQVGGDLELAS